MPDYSTEIARLEELLNSSATSIRIGDMSTEIDPDEVRKRLEELKRLDTSGQYGSRRPKMVPYKFGGLT